MLKRRLKDFLKRTYLRFYKLGLRLKVHILPVHYYSALPNLVELEKGRELWARKSELPGVEVNLGEQASNLRRICLPYQKEYAGNRGYRDAVSGQLGPGFGYIEAQALHGVLRHFKPRRVVEIGGGVSTYCMVRALEANPSPVGQAWSLTCIEPFPSAALRSLAQIQLIRQSVQAVSLELFGQLSERDLLFVDSSHVVKVGSDVNHTILEVLPRLAAGVVIHFHDINFPYDYSRGVLQDFFQGTETSLLRAFLIFNPKVEILFCLSHLHYERQDVLREVFPEYDPQADLNGLRHPRYKPFQLIGQHFPSSIYLQVR